MSAQQATIFEIFHFKMVLKGRWGNLRNINSHIGQPPPPENENFLTTSKYQPPPPTTTTSKYQPPSPPTTTHPSTLSRERGLLTIFLKWYLNAHNVLHREDQLKLDTYREAWQGRKTFFLETKEDSKAFLSFKMFFFKFVKAENSG